MPNRAFIALLLLIPAPSIGTAAAMFWWPELPIGKIIFFLSKIWLVGLPLVWLLFVDKQKISASPARNGGFIPAILSGMFISLVILVAYWAAIYFNALDPITVADRAAKTGLNKPAIYIAGAVYWITLNSLMEEYVWRWFVFRKFEILVGGKMAVVASALAFAAHHVVALAAQFNWPITILGSIGGFIGGATWSWLYQRYRSVWLGYVSHAIVDFAIFVIGYRLIFN
jgi:membrane protease YdiL (CAAX protease family)